MKNNFKNNTIVRFLELTKYHSQITLSRAVGSSEKQGGDTLSSEKQAGFQGGAKP